MSEEKPIHPTITKAQFRNLGFKQIRWRSDPETGGTWSMMVRKDLNEKHMDYIEIRWFRGTQRYEVDRHTENIKNMPLFQGFLRSVDDLKYIYELFDLRRFYETKTGPDGRLLYE